MIQTLNLFIGHSVHCRLKNRKTQPKDAQFFSWDIYISISLWISLHVSICKGSLSGNQTEAIPRNRLSNSFYWDSHIKNKYICKVWNGCKIPTNFNRETLMGAHDNRSNLPVCGWQLPHNMCTVNVLRCTYYYYYYYHYHHHHHHCQKIHLVLRAPWIYWGGGWCSHGSTHEVEGGEHLPTNPVPVTAWLRTWLCSGVSLEAAVEYVFIDNYN